MVTIRYQTINRRGELDTRDRTFLSQAAMERWVEREEKKAEEESGGFVGVTAYSYSATRCERCGSDKPSDQSCGCFDNGSQ